VKTYAVRKKLRIPLHCQFYCVTDHTLIDETVRDLSEMGLRVTVECPVPVGLEQPIVITLQEGKDCYHLVVHSAIVRWANGCVPGWEFLQIDELDHTRVTDFLEQREREELN
jgi:c-di-GMP-binding flagellar brake protein YcgR